MIANEVIIIGAGPYGLAAAAHLRARGLEVRVFGEPMAFWERNMPAGMFLRSNWTATRIADPKRALTLEAFEAATGRRLSVPVPIEQFISYGQWYQREAVPDLDHRKVVRVEVCGGAFRVHLENGEAMGSCRVVIAAGIGAFAWWPAEFQLLPASLASHTSLHHNFRHFAGKRVIVVGCGQSALESAALLRESGSDVEVVGRSASLRWLQGRLSKTLHHHLGTGVRRLLYAPTDVGPAGLSQLMARPDLLRKLPRELQDRLRRRAVRPAGARWLVGRLAGVPMRLGRSFVAARIAGGRVKGKLDDGTELTADHILLGTGYRVDISKYGFVSPSLLESIERFNGYPVLREGFETSVDGLHFLGAPAAWSFGPLMQFVSGTTYACRALTRAVMEKRSG